MLGMYKTSVDSVVIHVLPGRHRQTNRHVRTHAQYTSAATPSHYNNSQTKSPWEICSFLASLSLSVNITPSLEHFQCSLMTY